MKDLKNIECLIRDFSKSRQAAIQITPEFDARVLDNASRVHQENFQNSVPRRFNMRKLGVAAAVVLLLTIGLGLWLSQRMGTPAHAAEIIQAIRNVETVHMLVDFYNQGEFECWMRFDGDPDNPSHFWMQDPNGTLISKICSPSGAFLLNPRTHRVLICSRDERVQGWILKFGSFFEDNLRAARRNDAIRFKWQSSNVSKEPIEIQIETRKRTQEFLVDPGTRLPISFTTVRDDDPREMTSQTLAVKNIRWIRYNEEPPQGIFDLPKDAVVVEKEEDCIVGPDSSMIADGMTPQDACIAIATQAGQAFIDLDSNVLPKLAPIFRLSFFWDQSRPRKAAGKWPSQFAIKGIPYQTGDHWYVPVELRSDNGSTDIMTLVIKFYQFDGRTYCTIVDSKEKANAHAETNRQPGIYSGGLNQAHALPNPLYTFPDRDEKTRGYVEATVKRFRKDLDPGRDIKSDRELTEQDIRTRTIYIYGSPENHRLFQRVRNQLPIVFERDGVIVGNKKCLGRDVGAIFVCPNPLNPVNRLIIYGTVSPEALDNMNGIFHGPTDYVVFNQATRQFTEANPADRYLLLGSFDKSDPAHWRVDEGLQLRPPEALQSATARVVVTR